MPHKQNRTTNIHQIKKDILEITRIIEDNRFELSENNSKLNYLENSCQTSERKLEVLLDNLESKANIEATNGSSPCLECDDLTVLLAEKDRWIDTLTARVDQLKEVNESLAEMISDKDTLLKDCLTKATASERALSEACDRLEAVENELGFMENDKDDLEKVISEQDCKLQCLREDLKASRDRQRVAEYTAIRERWYCNEAMRKNHKKNDQMVRERRRWTEAILSMKNKGKIEDLNVALEDVLKTFDAEDEIRQLEIKVAESELLKLEDKREKTKMVNELNRLRYIVQVFESSNDFKQCMNSLYATEREGIWGSESPCATNLRRGEGDCYSCSTSPTKTERALQPVSLEATPNKRLRDGKSSHQTPVQLLDTQHNDQEKQHGERVSEKHGHKDKSPGEDSVSPDLSQSDKSPKSDVVSSGGTDVAQTAQTLTSEEQSNSQDDSDVSSSDSDESSADGSSVTSRINSQSASSSQSNATACTSNVESNSEESETESECSDDVTPTGSKSRDSDSTRSVCGSRTVSRTTSLARMSDVSTGSYQKDNDSDRST